ncbi:MAG TPA: PaaI family thioesterase [Blastocatellia bacterium]|nr:PaaI family thioesterase [Blastocatellia bacterium]
MRVEGRIEFHVVEQTPERVISEMPIQPGIKNPHGGVHAGAILWFADVTATVLAFGSADFSEGVAGFPLAITLNANFASNQKEGKLKAVACFVKKGKTVTIVRTSVFGENDKLIADVTTTHVPAK